MPSSAWKKDVCSRSEEHTSELQSLTNLVCRLLLEKNVAMMTYVGSCLLHCYYCCKMHLEIGDYRRCLWVFHLFWQSGPYIFFQGTGDPRVNPSFPTGRSSV